MPVILQDGHYIFHDKSPGGDILILQLLKPGFSIAEPGLKVVYCTVGGFQLIPVQEIYKYGSCKKSKQQYTGIPDCF